MPEPLPSSRAPAGSATPATADPLDAFANAPAEVVTGFEKMMGVTFFFGDKEVPTFINILVLIVTGVVFLLLAILSMSVKKKQ